MRSLIFRVPPWFERTFDFSFPVELFPNICARLRGTPVRLERLLADAPASLLTERRNGKWSIQENAGHLLDLEPLWRARLRDYLIPNAELTPADLQNRKTNEADHNSNAPATLFDAFRTERMAFLEEVEQADEAALSRTLVHPRLKIRMRLVDHLYFVAEHDDHHLAEMWQLIVNP
jgi:uncharacterized damage-inducible protein DinB